MYQRPLSQGRLALQALYQFLLNGDCPSARIHVVPHLVMQSNLELFLERLPVDLKASPALAPDRTVSRRLDMTSPSPRAPVPRPRQQRRSVAP